MIHPTAKVYETDKEELAC